MTILAVAILTLLATPILHAGQGSDQRHRVLELRLKNEVLAQELAPPGLRLPQLRVYDAQGRQVADFGSGFSDSFKQRLEAVLKSPQPTNSERNLKWEVERTDGLAGGTVPDADFTIVEYWAEWCVPCQALAKVVKEVISSHSDLSVNVLHVEADPQKAFPDKFGKKQEESLR